jgi:hypothetical protein
MPAYNPPDSFFGWGLCPISRPHRRPAFPVEQQLSRTFVRLGTGMWS